MINSTAFDKVMGVGDGGEPITLEKDDEFNPIRRALLEEKNRLIVDDLMAQVVGMKASEEMFVMHLFLLALGTILCQTSGTHINQLFIPLVCDIRSLFKKN